MSDYLSTTQRGIVFHASGLSRSDEQYRNYYCDSADRIDLLTLVEKGFMTGPHYRETLGHGMAYFFLTEKGAALAWEIKNGAKEEGK